MPVEIFFRESESSRQEQLFRYVDDATMGCFVITLLGRAVGARVQIEEHQRVLTATMISVSENLAELLGEQSLSDKAEKLNEVAQRLTDIVGEVRAISEDSGRACQMAIEAGRYISAYLDKYSPPAKPA